MSKREYVDLVGRQFNQLTVEAYCGKNRQGNLWRCLCVCGRKRVCSTQALNSNRVFSCGCKRVNTRIIKVDGIKYSLAEAARHFGIDQYVLRIRLERGWEVHRALSQPIMKRRDNVPEPTHS